MLDDNEYDYNVWRTDHPHREIFTMSVAALASLAIVAWGIATLWGLFR